MSNSRTISKLHRRTLLLNAPVEVSVLDVSLADAPSKTLATRTLPLGSQQLPFAFELPVRVDILDANRRYVIRDGNRLSYITNTVFRSHAETPTSRSSCTWLRRGSARFLSMPKSR